MTSEFIHSITNGRISFFCLQTEQSFIVHTYTSHIFFVHLSFCEYLGCFHLLATVSDAAGSQRESQIFLHKMEVK